jgi:hypothetical protein
MHTFRPCVDRHERPFAAIGHHFKMLRRGPPGVCQTSCPPISCSVSNFRDANFFFGVEPDWSGRLPVSVFPDQRCRFCAQTVTQRVARFANVSRSIPPWRALGVTKRIALCKCLSLYQSAKDFTQACASALLAKPLLGQFGRYLKVRNRAAHLWCWCAGIDQADNPSCIAQRD